MPSVLCTSGASSLRSEPHIQMSRLVSTSTFPVRVPSPRFWYFFQMEVRTVVAVGEDPRS